MIFPPIPEFLLDLSKLDEDCHLFKSNDVPGEDDAATLPKLQKDRETLVANISAIDARMEMLAAQMLALGSKKEELAQRVTLIDSVFYIMRRLPDDVLTEIFLACCPSPTYAGEGFFGDGLELHDWSDSLDPRLAPWVFTHVCRRWRNLAIHSPALWAVIAVDADYAMRDPERSLAALSLRSERARLHRTSLSIDLATPLRRLAFRFPSSLFSNCTQLQVITTDDMIYDLKEFISCLALLSFMELALKAADKWQFQPYPLVLCHESARLSALRLSDKSHLSLFHLNLSRLVSLHVSGIILDAACMVILQELSTQALELEVLSLNDIPSGFESRSDHHAPPLPWAEYSLLFPRLRTLSLVQSGATYILESEAGLKPLTALILILRLPSLQSFRYQIGSDNCEGSWAPYSRHFRVGAVVLPAATHMHIIMKRGYDDEVVKLFKAAPHITSVLLEPYIFSNLRSLFGNVLPFLSRLEIRAGNSMIISDADRLRSLVEMLSMRRANGFSLPRIVVDVSLVLQPSEADELLERWHEFCRAGVDGREVVFRD